MRSKLLSLSAVYAALVSLVVGGAPPSAKAQTIPGVPQIPQIPAFLPDKGSVPAGEPTPIDGVWRLDANQVRYQIDGARIYALDGYLHAFVLKVQPGMVVVKDIVRTGLGTYEGYDLPLIGKWQAKLQPDQTLALHIQGALGPVNLKLTPVQLDNPSWLAQELGGVGGSPPQAGYPPPRPDAGPPGGPPSGAEQFRPPAGAPPPAATECAYVRYDPDTGQLACVQ